MTFSGPTHVTGQHDLVLYAGQNGEDEGVEELLSRSIVMIRFRCIGMMSLCWSVCATKMIHPGILMDSNGLLRASGEFLVVVTGDPFEALAHIWNAVMTRAIGMVFPRHLLPWSTVKVVPWFSREVE